MNDHKLPVYTTGPDGRPEKIWEHPDDKKHLDYISDKLWDAAHRAQDKLEARIKELEEYIEWTKDTRDEEGIPASYEEIYDRACEVLEREDE